MRVAYRIMVRKREGKNRFRDIDVDGRIGVHLKRLLEKVY